MAETSPPSRVLRHASIALMAKALAELIEGPDNESAKEAWKETSWYYQQAAKFAQDWRTSNLLPEVILMQESANKGFKVDSSVDLQNKFDGVMRNGSRVDTVNKALSGDEGLLAVVMASYQATQELFEKNFRGEIVRAWRGFQWPSVDEMPDWAKGTEMDQFSHLDETLFDDKSAFEDFLSVLRQKGKSTKVKTTPLASYSLDPKLAYEFAFSDLEKGEVGTIVEATIPRNLVVSLPGVGLGNPDVAEVVAIDALTPVLAISIRKT